MKRISYMFSYEVNYGTDEEPKIEVVETPKIFECNDNNFDAAYAIAQSEAYGEITVEDIPNEDTPPSQLDQIEAQVTYTAMMTDTLLEV